MFSEETRNASASPTEASRAQVFVCNSSKYIKKHDQKPAPDVEQATSMVNEQVNEPGTLNMFYSNMRMGVSQHTINSVRLYSENIVRETAR